MNETIEATIIRNPEVTEAIRHIKSTLVSMAKAQKENKDKFRRRQSEWSKTGGDCPRKWDDKSDAISALHIIHGRLRQTKRPHISDIDAYFSDKGLGSRRWWAYKYAKEGIAKLFPAVWNKMDGGAE